jgi:hypothetical protein
MDMIELGPLCQERRRGWEKKGRGKEGEREGKKGKGGSAYMNECAP